MTNGSTQTSSSLTINVNHPQCGVTQRTSWRLINIAKPWMFSCALHWCVAWKITIFSSSVSREALCHAYEALKAADDSGVNFPDFLLFMEEFKPEICEKYDFLIWCIFLLLDLCSSFQSTHIPCLSATASTAGIASKTVRPWNGASCVIHTLASA